MGGDTAALIFACKTILGLSEPRGDEFNVHLSATATANAKPASGYPADSRGISDTVTKGVFRYKILEYYP